MKDGIKKIVGKCIRGVLVARTARSHVFLIFTDNTYFEFWGTDIKDEIQGCSDIDKGGLDEAKDYIRGAEILLETHDSKPIVSRQKATAYSEALCALFSLSLFVATTVALAGLLHSF